jgi:hypothetical protein
LSDRETSRPRRPEPISIWTPRDEDGETVWVRSEPSPLGDHFAATPVLRRKRAELPLRVAFFGESVAAGYLYSPHFTPARVLEEQLQSVGTAGDFEVIDLARTNETLPSLAATVRASLQIQPDLLVLFVGNNWNLLETPEVSAYAPSVRARQRFGAALREEGIAGPIRLAEEELRQTAEGTFELIALIARTVGIPVVVVVPEVNLADWETRQPPVRLPGDGTARWHAQYVRGGEEAARAMLDLDGGACPTSWRLLARATGDPAAARAEVDAARYATLAFLSAPQATTAAREILHDLAHRHGFSCIDLRDVFAESLPGSRLFLDYCHLTSEGISLAMAAVAREVVRLSGLCDEPGELPLPRPSPEVEATARLGAAIHGAHRLLPVGPKRPFLERWCEAALDASPGIEEAMRDLIAVRCAPVPAVLTAAQQRNLASPYRLTLQHGWRWDHLDADLLLAIVAVLERRGLRVRDDFERQLQTHAPRPGGTDLAHPFYLWEPLERFYPEVMDLEDLARRATLRSPWPETGFCLIADGVHGIELALTARLPEGGTGPVELSLDGHSLDTVEIGPRWAEVTLRIPAQPRGLHRLVLRWPAPPPVEGDPFRRVVERLELGLAADLHPVFGEVFSLVARPV